MEEQLVLNGDNAYNAHFGESMASLGDIDDDGFPGQCISFFMHALCLFLLSKMYIMPGGGVNVARM